MEDKLYATGLFLEQNVNAEIGLILASAMLLPAFAYAVTRYVYYFFTGKDIHDYFRRKK